MLEKSIAFAPATIANISAGFDVLGMAIEGLGDTVELIPTQHGLKILDISNGDGLPYDPDKNSCSVVVKSVFKEANYTGGANIRIRKGFQSGSGMGSSSASSAAAALAANHFLGNPFSQNQLVKHALEGEFAACGVRHADNVAPSILGGITLIKSLNPIEVISLPVPNNLFVVILHPKIELKTKDSRKLLKSRISLSQVSEQLANIAGFVTGLHQNDYALIGRSVKDVLVEPLRSIVIPLFPEMRSVAMKAKALAFGIAGSGPSVFALCNGKDSASNVELALSDLYETSGIQFETHLSKINNQGATIVDNY